MLKLIPQENPLPKDLQKIKKKSFMLAAKFLQKMEAGFKQEEQIVYSACTKLIGFVKKTGNIDLHDMSELISSLQRTVITLEKKRVKMLRKEKKRK